MFQCKPCGKVFSGQCNYDQHLESIKHKKKLSQVNFFNCHNVPSVDSCLNIPVADSRHEIQWHCTTCGTAFDTVENFKKHVESPEHAKKVMEKAEGKVSDNVVSTSTHSTENVSKHSTEMMNVDGNELLVPGFNAQKLFYEKCEACDKTFSGPEPYKQHMQSNEHQRKTAILSSETNLNMTSLTCNICKKCFSGHVPYMQHINSETHKKKVQQFQLMQSLSSKKESDTGKEDIEITNQWYCKVCSKQCSGLIPYQDHLKGTTHFKNLKKAELMNNLMKTGESTNHSKQENGSEIKSLDSQLVKGECLQQSVQKMEEDYILPETGSRLEVMSTSELKKLVTVILPDENIDFDKLEKNKSAEVIADEGAVEENSDSHLGRGDELDDQNSVNVVPEKKKSTEEVEEKSVFQVCELCDVKLYDKDDVICHYESQGHFKRKWNSD